jgi:glycosyltransferase involved in cell wall biosynthesis
MKHILIIASYGPSLINFRIDLIKNLLRRGYNVSVACPKINFSIKLQKKLRDLRIKIIFFSLDNTGLNFFKDFKSILEIYKIIKRSKPDLIISYTAKPVIYSGIILKFFKNVSYFPLITGLGYTFIYKKSLRHKILRYLIIKLYKKSLKNSKKVIFQNKDDQNLFLKLKIIKKKKSSKIVNGSGVDLKKYPLSNLPKKPIFLMISRLLIDKGVREYFEASKIVTKKFPNVKFLLAGYLDNNPSGISSKELKSLIKESPVDYLGHIESVQSILKSCKYYVLPSYREGTPRSTLEALSTGRPIITTNTPGCRETVIHEKNGLLVPIKNSDALADAMIILLKKNEKILKRMAYKSFLIAKRKFEINKVNQNMLDIMNL